MRGAKGGKLQLQNWPIFSNFSFRIFSRRMIDLSFKSKSSSLSQFYIEWQAKLWNTVRNLSDDFMFMAFLLTLVLNSITELLSQTMAQYFCKRSRSRFRLKGYWSCISAFSSKIIRHIIVHDKDVHYQNSITKPHTLS